MKEELKLRKDENERFKRNVMSQYDFVSFCFCTIMGTVHVHGVCLAELGNVECFRVF